MDCQLCGRPGTIPCPGCASLFYCCEKHRRRHAKVGHDERECNRLRIARCDSAARQDELPFPWADHKSACEILQRAGLHGAGEWVRECDCAPFLLPQADLGHPPTPLTPRSTTTTTTTAREQDAARTDTYDCEEGREAIVTSSVDGSSDEGSLRGFSNGLPPTLTAHQLSNWRAYCSARRLPHTSLAPLLISAPLTLASVLASAGGEGIGRAARQWIVHWLGPQAELERAPTAALREVMVGISPGSSLILRMIGPDVSQKNDGLGWCLSCPESGKQMDITAHTGMYHDLIISSNSCDTATPSPHQSILRETPDVVFAPNAGLAAYPSWLPTIRMLCQPGAPPCVFTDYTEDAARLGSEIVGHMLREHGGVGVGGTGGPVVPSCGEYVRGSELGGDAASGETGVVVVGNALRCPAVSPSGTAVIANRDGWMIVWNGRHSPKE